MSPSLRPSAFLLVVGLVGLVDLVACAASSSAADADAGAPAGCSGVASASDPTALAHALAAAGKGACVRATAGTYKGSFAIPPGVTLLGEGDATVFVGGTTGEPALTLQAGAGLQDVLVRDAPAVAVAVRQGPATIARLHVEAARTAAVAILCRGAECAGQAATVALVEPVLRGSGTGLWASGARVRVTGGESSGHASRGALSGGGGVVAQDGADVELAGTKVERNEGVGVLVDGAGGTRATLKDVRVAENGERGVWAQRLAGTATAPGLRIEGDRTAIERNAVVGVGAADSRGIIVVGGKIAGTVAKKLPTDLGQLDDVGDGLGLFSGTGEVRVENVSFEGNARAAGLVDAAKAGIIVVGGKVAPAGGGLGFVVQNTSEAIALPEGFSTPASRVLGVSAPTIGLAKVIE